MSRSPLSRLRGLVPSAAWLLAVPLGAAPSAGGPPKTHTLFMGVDLAIFAPGGGTFPVRDVQNNSFVAFDGPKPIVASSRDDQFKLKIDHALKLSPVEAAIDHLKFERTYSPEHDPMTRFAQNARVAAYLAAGVDEANLALRQAENASGLANGQLAAIPTDANPEARAPFLTQVAATGAAQSQAEAALSAAQASDRMSAFDPVATSGRLTSDLAAGQFDALNVTFDLSTPRPLHKPYLVVIMRYLAEPDRPDSASVWVYAESLPVIDEHPRPFLIRRAGFPPGYHIDSYHVHLYDGGTEVATNVSPKRVALTTEEAFDYVVLDYLATHPGETRAPAKADGFWPRDLASRMLPEKLNRTLYVQVGKDGRATGIFADAEGRKPIEDPDLAALAPELHFLPALEKGKPAASTAAVKLGRKP